MTVTRKKRPRDPLQLAKLIGDIATGQTEDRDTKVDKKGRPGGEKGGPARAKSLPPERRSQIASIAAQAVSRGGRSCGS